MTRIPTATRRQRVEVRASQTGPKLPRLHALPIYALPQFTAGTAKQCRTWLSPGRIERTAFHRQAEGFPPGPARPGFHPRSPMTRRNHGIAAIALGAVVALTAAGCGGGGGAPSPAAINVTSAGPAKAGGTLYYLTNQPADHLDPQRTYITRDIANEVRMVYRTLTSFPVASGKAGTKLVADLATDAGTASDGAKSWKFTLKDGVKWQDGSDITCADLKYGVSRAFATTVITGGPSYAPQFLDIPTDPKSGSLYKGPYSADPAGQGLYDKAVTCDAKTITFRLSKPVADFNYAVSKPTFAPYKADQDKGDKSNFTVFSSGPYQLQGSWTQGQGGTFVRNPSWNA